MSLKEQIKQYLKDNYPRVVHKGTLGKLAVNEWGRENENMGRRCRELENEGKIIKVYNKKNEVQYQWNGEGFDENTQLKAIIERFYKGKIDLWQDYYKFREIHNALEGRNKYLKQGIINKYAGRTGENA